MMTLSLSPTRAVSSLTNSSTPQRRGMIALTYEPILLPDLSGHCADRLRRPGRVRRDGGVRLRLRRSRSDRAQSVAPSPGRLPAVPHPPLLGVLPRPGARAVQLLPPRLRFRLLPRGADLGTAARGLPCRLGAAPRRRLPAGGPGSPAVF